MKIIKEILRKVILYVINNKHYYIAALVLRIFIKERDVDGKNRTIYSKANNCITILALDSDRYRGDLEALASVPNFRVLIIRQRWQVLFLSKIYSNIYNMSPYDSLNSKLGEAVYAETLLAQEFTYGLLKTLFSIIRVDCLTSVHYRYIEDLDWTLASEKLGIPYVMLYRECLLQKKTRIYDEVVKRHKKYRFHGSHIIVHNNTCKDAFIESKYCKEKDVSVIGALRMDRYLKTLNNISSYAKNKRKIFILFYFPYDMSLFGKDKSPPEDCKYKYAYSVWHERKSLFRDIHVTIAELAIEHPEIDFIIKPKNTMMTSPSWLFYEQVLMESGFNKDDMKNYLVEPDADVHELILNSDVICALQSSTVIESAISGKPVILPIFENYRETKNYKDFSWRGYTGLFNVANNKGHFKKMIIDLMNTPSVSDSILSKRRNVFKRFFNDLNGDSLSKYVEVITKVVKNS